jgi:hypothetical protein
MKKFFGRNDFTWFVGVVEDRDDPVQLGRVKVRCFGWHTEDTTELPTKDLPWAIPVNSITSASVSGVGRSPTGIVEGSWVVGFFMDGERAQEPMILGTIYGAPTNLPETNVGFNDPLGAYPKYVDESDVNFGARESTFDETSWWLNRVAGRLKSNGEEIKYNVATPPKIPTVAPNKENSYYEEPTWAEMFVGGAAAAMPMYPYNHVYESESGHVVEFDDTEGQRRYHRYHPSGSFEEVVDGGDRTVKIVGKDYELVLDGKNIYIDGDLNVTVTGNKRELIKGNYHLEVDGETSFNLKSSWQTKVNQNQETEVGKSRSTNIGVDDNLSVMGNQAHNIIGNRSETVKGNHSEVVSGTHASIAYKESTIFSGGNMVHTVTGNFTSTIQNTHTLGQNVFNITTQTTKTETASTGNITYGGGEITVGTITHTQHTHPYTAGVDAEGDGPPVG